MKKKSLPKPITILVLTLMTAVVWVGLSIYRAVTIKPAPTVSEDILKPLNPTLNTSAIDQMESSIYFEDSEIPEISIGVSQTPGPVSTPTEAPSAELEESPSSSASAEEI